jgi:hypothetical protein
MKLFFTIIIFYSFLANLSACQTVKQDTLPYYQLPDYPAQYTPESVVARMIDGVGFRFYWATEGLRPEDLKFRPTKEARTSEETIDHILGLSTLILNGLQNKINTKSGEETSSLTFDVKRQKVLENLKTASDLLKSSNQSLEKSKMLFKNGDKTTELPFWNEINGPISDALWHIGQVVTFRRSSGNPFNSKVNVLTGMIRR